MGITCNRDWLWGLDWDIGEEWKRNKKPLGNLGFGGFRDLHD